MVTSIIHAYRDDPRLRQSFNRLARDTFGLDFEPWYQNGFWGGQYDPWSLVLDGQVAANVSVNRIDCLLDGQRRRYLQLGTVMTRKSLQGRGFNRRVMEAVLAEREAWDGVFLYANDTVLDYYPRFGFQAAAEYRYRAFVTGSAAPTVRPVPMETPADWQHFQREKSRRHSLGLLQLETDGLLLFYLSQSMRDAVFFVPEADAYVLAEQEGELLTVYDAFSSGPVPLLGLCQAFGPSVRQVELAFTPASREGLEEYAYRGEDTTLFVSGSPLVQDLERLRGFPELAHA